MDVLVQLLINGLVAGSIYGIVAVGYSMVYSILRFVNFAHGYVAMIGMYLAYTFSVRMGMNFFLSAVSAILLSCLLGWSVERAAYRPLRRSFYLAPLITSIGVSFLLEAIALLVWGADIRSYDIPVREGLEVLGARITMVQIWIIAALLLSLMVLMWLLNRTILGVAIRATADDQDMARMLGVDADSIIVVVFLLGSAMAAVAGILLGLETNLQPTMGLVVTVKAFAAVILGGLGNIYGGLIGGLLIGFAENLGIWFIPAVWKDAIAYAILLVILLVKPSGLFGQRRESEVKL
ncbi:MAG TPA: branched-chain amino acid ABC transporter permease [Clostridia bacterium]|nr:branched-chain amino acid ABC transporter permease [Clostridia bacterium]